MNSQIIVEKNICAAPLATSPTLVGVKNGEAMELEMISTPMDLTVSQYLSKFKCTLYIVLIHVHRILYHVMYMVYCIDTHCVVQCTESAVDGR